MEEAEAVASILNAHAVEDIGTEDTAFEQLRSSWDSPGRELDRDVIVAEEGGRAVGYLEVDGEAPWTTVRIDGYEHPDRWGRGIGSALIRQGEKRARELAARAASAERVVLFHGAWHGGRAAAGGERLRPSPGVPALWFVAVEGDRVASITICERATPEEADCGWVDDVAVRRPWRREASPSPYCSSRSVSCIGGAFGMRG